MGAQIGVSRLTVKLTPNVSPAPKALSGVEKTKEQSPNVSPNMKYGQKNRNHRRRQHG